MNLTTFVLPAVLTLALIIMFIVGLRSLATINRPQPVPPTPVSPRPGPRPAVQETSTPDETDEWEANPQWAEHVAHVDVGTDEDLPRGRSSVDHDASFPGSAHADDIHDESRDALHEDLRDVSDLFNHWAPTHTATAATATPPSSTDILRCPRCRSSRIDTRNRARKAGSTIGSVAGATGAMTAALAGAETGAVVGSIAGPIGTVFGGLAGAVIAGLVGSAAGCAAGSAVGAAIDENVLDNHQCLACGHTFSVK